MGKSSLDTKISDVMTTEIVTITPDFSVEDCMALMTDCHIRHLPVIDNDKLVGLVSIGDVVKAVINGQARLIISLENYILGVDYGKV
jgi:CBS domain-containing protein